MKEISKEDRTWKEIMVSRTLHVFALGYEERCLAYPGVLSDEGLSGKHRFLCIVPPDEHVTWYLKRVREQHRTRIMEMLPGTHTGPWPEIRDEISRDQDLWDTYCLDISSLPRSLIFEALEQMNDAVQLGKNAFVVYTFPADYAYGPLQSPASDVTIHFPEPRLRANVKIATFLIPGFDVEYTNLALAYIKGATQLAPDIRWLLPFPGRRYAFYERALERHAELLADSKLVLFPQDELALALKELVKQAESVPALPVYFVPLGSRINCIPVFLATLLIRMQNRDANILYPKTLRHSSIRSTGFTTPLIERLPTNPSQ